jgi:hypothetical protein
MEQADPMRIHELVVAWMHLAVGLFVLACVAALWAAAAQLAPLFEGSFVPGLFAMFGRPIAAVFIAVAALEALAAVALLRRQAWARAALVGIGALQVVIFPIGTAASFYTFWTLLRRQPSASP